MLTRTMRSLVVAIALAAGLPALAEAPPEPGTVVLYRLGGANLAALSATVTLDGETVAKLARKQRTELRLAPGRYRLAAKALGYASQAGVEVEVIAGQPLYFELRPNKKRPGLFAAGVPVAGDMAVAAEAASSLPFLFEARDEAAYLGVLDDLRLVVAQP